MIGNSASVSWFSVVRSASSFKQLKVLSWLADRPYVLVIPSPFAQSICAPLGSSTQAYLRPKAQREVRVAEPSGPI